MEVIKTFRCAETGRLHNRQPSRRFRAIERIARRKLRQLDSAAELRDLAAPPGNRLEALHGDRMGQYSVRITDQWRLCFVWRESNAYKVEIVDYHGSVIVREHIHGLTGPVLENTLPKSQKLLPPIHPGEILRADFMEPLQLSMNRLALDLHVPVTRVAEIVHGRRGISPDTALRLARYFNTSARFWLNLQSAYDLEAAEDELSRTIQREVRPATPASEATRS